MIERTYLGVIEQGPESFGIVFPDFPGFTSVGESIDHVLTMAREGLAFHIAGMVEDGESLPQPSSVTVEQVRTQTPEGNWIAIGAVTVPVPALPDTIDISLKSDLVREIAEAVDTAVDKMTPRQFIEQITRRELDRLKKSA